MSGSPKKTNTEKAAIRQAQNQRYRNKKRASGLVQIAVWVPAEVAEKAKGMQKIGVVVTEDKNASPLSIMSKGPGGAWLRPL